MKLNWNILGERGCKTNNLPWEEYEYFLKLHNVKTNLHSMITLSMPMFLLTAYLTSKYSDVTGIS